METKLPPVIHLGEPDFLDPIEMLPSDPKTKTVTVHVVNTVWGEPSFKDLGEPDYLDEDDLGFPEPDSFMVNITVTSIEEGEVQFYESDADIIIDEPFEIKG